MNAFSVVVIAFLTAAMTAFGSVYVIQKYNILPAHPQVSEVLVPDLRGLSESDARANANVAHIALLIASREPSAEAKPGAVVRQSVPSGQHVAKDYTVSVVLAEEAPKVPTVTGLTVADATQKLEKAGYTLTVGNTIADATVAPGTIIEQSPKADTAEAKGAAVTVQVSGGPGEVPVPKLMGLGLVTAKANLEKIGLKPAVRWVSLAETATYVVLNQKPAPGDKVKPGADIELTVNQ
jgi:eukaryotic-like serine/threonine-protein kinase